MAELTSNRFPEARRTNLPTDQTERFMEDEDKAEGGFDPEESLGNYPTLRWNRSGAHDTDFQHGPLYIHEKIHPGELIESVLKEKEGQQQDLFAQFNGLPHNADFEWYRHEGYWQNRLIHGDAHRVMASLANREGLTQQVQMIYIDPPYNIKFGANFQLRTDETETKESGNDLPHDPLSIKAFRDQYSGNIDTYLDNLYGQLTLARSLLNETGSCFLQIGPENLHEVALLMSEVFGKDNHVATIPYRVATNQSTRMLPEIGNWILWYAKDSKQAKFRQIYVALENRRERVSHMASYAMCETHDGKIRNLTAAERNNPDLMPEGSRLFRRMRLTSAHTSTTGRSEPFQWDGQVFSCPSGMHWRVSHEGLQNIAQSGRLVITERGQLAWKRYEDEVPGRHLTAIWTDFGAPQDKRYIVQTPDTAIERCILMTTDPGDLIIDPTCGAGTTAYLAEKWGRRWITIDTSRVAVAVARQTLTTSKYAYFLLQDSDTGAHREAALSGQPVVSPTGTENVALGFVYERIPRVSAATLAYDIKKHIHFVDKPIVDRGKTRICSPFTVESDSPTRAIAVDAELTLDEEDSPTREQILEALPIAGINFRGGKWQVSNLEDFPAQATISHTATLISTDGTESLKAAIYIAPEDSTVSGHQVRRAASDTAKIRELNALVVIAFAFEAGTTDSEYDTMGRIRVFRVEANRDLVIPGLKNLPSDSAFTVIGEPDVDLRWTDEGQLELEVLGIDTYDPKQRTVTIGKPVDIHCIMTDTDYDGLSFKTRRINFPNQTKDRRLNRIKKDFKRTIDERHWKRLFSPITIPFNPPIEGRIAVKVIDRAAMETMRILEVPERADEA